MARGTILLCYSPLKGMLLVICLAVQGTLGPVFIVNAGQQLTAFGALLLMGQVIRAVLEWVGVAGTALVGALSGPRLLIPWRFDL
jgi:hypothetical protein